MTLRMVTSSILSSNILFLFKTVAKVAVLKKARNWAKLARNAKVSPFFKGGLGQASPKGLGVAN